jgi:transcriptional regulator with XRE-family HTH domain
MCDVSVTDIRLRFGKAVRNLRHQLGVSQEEFADICGLDRTYIGGIERGERNVSLVNIERIAKALKISITLYNRRILVTSHAMRAIYLTVRFPSEETFQNPL